MSTNTDNKLLNSIDITSIDIKLKNIKILNQLSNYTKISELYIAATFISLVSLTILLAYGPGPCTNLIAFIYPLYASYTALNTPGGHDDEQWLTYWIIYGFLNLLEDFLFLPTFVPMYFLLKLAFLMFCFTNNGSKLVYEKTVKPFFVKYSDNIKEAINTASQIGAKIASNADKNLDKVVDTAQDAVDAELKKGN